MPFDFPPFHGLRPPPRIMSMCTLCRFRLCFIQDNPCLVYQRLIKLTKPTQIRIFMATNDLKKP